MDDLDGDSEAEEIYRRRRRPRNTRIPRTDRRLRRTPLGLPHVRRHDHLTKNDLYDEVEDIISAADFIEKTEGAQMLFI